MIFRRQNAVSAGASPLGKAPVGEQVGEQVNEQVAVILTACKMRPQTKVQLLMHWGLSNVYMNYKRHLFPLLEQSLLERTIPDKPNSRLQKYRLTPKGAALLKKVNLFCGGKA